MLAALQEALLDEGAAVFQGGSSAKERQLGDENRRLMTRGSDLVTDSDLRYEAITRLENSAPFQLR